MHKWIKFYVAVSLFYGFFGSSKICAYDMSYVPTLELGTGVFRDNNQWVNESKNLVIWWQPPVGYSQGGSGYAYHLYKQFNGGAWQPILNRNGNLYFSSWDLQYTATNLQLGRYKFRVQGCFYINGSYSCEEPGKDSQEVIVRSPPSPPSKPASLNVIGYTKLLNNTFIFETEVAYISIGDAQASGVTNKFYARKEGESAWTLLSAASVRGFHLEKKQIAAEACNQYGCSEKAVLGASILFDFPEVKNANFQTHLFPLNVFGNSSSGTQFCVANFLTGKCGYEYIELRAVYSNYVGNSSGINPLCLISRGVVLECNATGSFNHRLIGTTMPSVGLHTFEIRALNATGQVLERIHYQVYLPNTGELTGASCELALGAENCLTQLNWTSQGDYPVCIYKVNGNTKEELSCSTAVAAGQLPVNLTAKPEEFRLVAKEPGGDRTLSSLTLLAAARGISLSSSTPVCEISKPNTHCNSNISWSISADYPAACVFKNGVLYSCDTAINRDLNLAPGIITFEVRNGALPSSPLLAQQKVVTKYIASGSIVPISGMSDTCVPLNGLTSCTIEADITHWNVNSGATLYKNNESWSDFGLSTNGTPFTGKYSLTADQGGTHWSLRTMENGVLKEFASLDLYSTTLATSGYELLAPSHQCEFNPLVADDCQVELTWQLPALGGCIFEKGSDTPYYCPPHSPGSGNAHIKLGTIIYQLRTSDDAKSPLVAQVAAIAMEKKVADISVTRKKCINTSCDVALEIFSNFDGDVCLYDNGVKVEGYCGIRRRLSIGSYNLMDPLHKLELVLHAENNANTVIASKEVKGVPRHSSSVANVSASASSASGLSIAPSAKFKFAEGESGSCSLPVGFDECEVLIDIEHRNVNVGGVVLYKNEVPWANLGLSSEGTPYIDRYALTASREGTRWSLRLAKNGDFEEIAAVNLFSLATNEFLVGNKVTISAKNTDQLDNIKKILFYLDDQVIAEDSSYPYELNWTPTESGLWMIKVVAELHDLTRQTIDWVGIQVVDFPSQSYAHNLILQSPIPGKSVHKSLGNKIPLQATVYDQALREWKNSDGTAPVIDFYANNILISDGQHRSSEVFYWLPSKVGFYSIRAVAHLDEGKTIESVDANITISRPLSPVIDVVGGEAATVGNLYQMSASVDDPDRQLQSLVFLANGEPISVPQVLPPFHARWVPMMAGSYKLQAVITDVTGRRIRSAIKTVLVEPRIIFDGSLQGVSDFGDAESQGLRWTPLQKSDLLQVRTSNNSRISYNKLGKLLINRPLKIINRSDMYSNGIVPQLIVLDAGQIDLNSNIEIVGEPADLLIINTSGLNTIRCKNCGFINVERAVLAVATPANPLSSAMTQVGQLQTRAAGVIDIDNLQASGAVSIEIIADKVIAKGQINTQQYANHSSEVNSSGEVEQVLDFVTRQDVDSVVVGSGGVSLLQGNLRVDYNTMELDNAVAGTGVIDLQATISSGAINIFATDAIQLSGNLSTRSSHRAAQIYRGQLRAQEEQIQLKTIAQASTAPSVRIHGNVLSDAKVHVIGHSSEIKPDGGIHAGAVKVELIDKLFNQGYIRSYVRATSENPASDQVGIVIGAGTVDNRGEIQSMFNNAVGESSDTTPHGEIKIASVNDLYNRFGGLIKARTVKIVSEKGKIRNGSLYAFDGTATGGKESATTIQIAPHDTSLLSTHAALAFSASEPAVKNVTAIIVGDEVTLDAAQAVENINPYTEPYTTEAVEISAVSVEAENRANDVQIEALQKLSIVSDTYVLNSSAMLGVSKAASGNLLSIKAPAIRNERYYSRMIMESFSDHEKVQEQTNEEINNWARGVQSRYGFYSPPGYIYSFAKAEFDFGTTGDGLLNNISYVDLYGDLNVFGQGKITTRGISLEKLAYESGSTKVVSLSECIYHERGRTCSQSTSTYSRTPEGKLIKQSPDNTLFAVNGEISAPANVFGARNDQGLTVLRQEVIAQYKEETKKAAIDKHKASGTNYIDSRCDVSSHDRETESDIMIYQHFYSNNSNIKCFHLREYGEDPDRWKSDPPSTSDQVFAYTNITDLVNEKIVLMGNMLNQQINDYRAWREAAQATGN